MDIFLVRHGLSTGNGLERFMGWTDHPLSPQGINQANALAARFATIGPMPVYCSDLSRARMTAEIIASTWSGVVHTDERWREINFGEFEDRPWDVLTRDLELSSLLESNPLDTAPLGGESMTEMMTRANAAFAEIRALTLERVIIVSHGGPLHAVLAQCLLIPPERYWVLNFAHGSVTHLREENNWITIRSVSDTSHLTDTNKEE